MTGDKGKIWGLKFLNKMSECGCQYNCKWYFDILYKVEAFQSEIDDLYKISPIPKDKIRRSKIKRDKLLLQIEHSLNSEDWEGEEDEYYLRKALFKDSNVPIERSYYDRLPGEENAEATDWEYHGVSSDED